MSRDARAGPSKSLALPSWLRIRNETPAVQAALLAVPLAAGAALLVGGLLWWNRRAAAAGERVQSQSRWLRRILAGADVETAGREVLSFVQRTLIGLDRRSVRKLLGEPAAAGDAGVIVAQPEPARQRVAEQWFYRLDRPGSRARGGAALLVEFDERDRAAGARFLLPPGT